MSLSTAFKGEVGSSPLALFTTRQSACGTLDKPSAFVPSTSEVGCYCLLVLSALYSNRFSYY